jgi:hypothetical protein
MAGRNIKDWLDGVPSWPLLLDAPSAAKFLSLPDDLFEEAMSRGELPAPCVVAGILRWSRLALEARFAPDGAKPVPGHDPIAAAIAASA